MFACVCVREREGNRDYLENVRILLLHWFCNMPDRVLFFYLQWELQVVYVVTRVQFSVLLLLLEGISIHSFMKAI
jgi:hypothetical protein